MDWRGEEPEDPCEPPAPCTCAEWLSPRHPSCGSFAIAEQLEQAVLTGDLTRARALAMESPMVVLVPERHAVQVVGCAGEVMAHFGLTGGDFAVFTDSESRGRTRSEQSFAGTNEYIPPSARGDLVPRARFRCTSHIWGRIL